MKEHPILMSAPMVRAILDGRKTQTRRIVKPEPPDGWLPEVGIFSPTFIATDGEAYAGPEVFGASDESFGVKFPYGQPGDLLWVKETFSVIDDWVAFRADVKEGKIPYHYCLPEKAWSPWKPSIFMPRALSRITLEVTAVRVERLQDISEEDAKAEGCTFDEWTYPNSVTPGRSAYHALWESINGPGSWGANPWVWVVSFKKL